ncbi:MAG: helix-turn-helix domain-containing protein [Deltaproteobacteria bacterium]|uniref:Helix-turn-helix domain-containing protein n=1 Tax=Candidatus Zymogenus saltonus TaxID=2844893 RepID=A0A9D8PJE0_9DELT|nr:helix-turn-helix domain-containing protein [Candidatus Zymogenus saltonus]
MRQRKNKYLTNINPKKVSERLNELIKKTGLKQYQFAEKCNITAAALSTYLNKERIPESAILARIADFTNTSMEWLLTGKTVNEQIMEKGDEFHNQVLKDMADEIEIWREKALEAENLLRSTQEVMSVMESGGDYKDADPEKINPDEVSLLSNFRLLSEKNQEKVLEYTEDQIRVEKSKK